MCAMPHARDAASLTIVHFRSGSTARCVTRSADARTKLRNCRTPNAAPDAMEPPTRETHDRAGPAQPSRRLCSAGAMRAAAGDDSTRGAAATAATAAVNELAPPQWHTPQVAFAAWACKTPAGLRRGGAALPAATRSRLRWLAVDGDGISWYKYAAAAPEDGDGAAAAAASGGVAARASAGEALGGLRLGRIPLPSIASWSTPGTSDGARIATPLCAVAVDFVCGETAAPPHPTHLPSPSRRLRKRRGRHC